MIYERITFPEKGPSILKCKNMPPAYENVCLMLIDKGAILSIFDFDVLQIAIVSLFKSKFEF